MNKSQTVLIQKDGEEEGEKMKKKKELDRSVHCNRSCSTYTLKKQ